MLNAIKYDVKIDISDVDFEKVAEILLYHGLSSLDAKTQKKVFSNSYAVVFLYDEGSLFGVGRALSDGVSQAVIYNVALVEKYRGRGLGKVIVEEIMKQVPGCNVILYTAPQLSSIYEHWGFRRMKTGFAKYVDQDLYEAKGFI